MCRATSCRRMVEQIAAVDHQSKSGESRPLLWIGGWSADPRLHPFQPGTRTARARDVTPVDLSSCASASDFFIAVERALTATAGRRGSVDVAGWSMGAMLALDAAARHPSLVRRLVLFGATP